MLLLATLRYLGFGYDFGRKKKLESRNYASAVRASHHNKISLGQGNDNTDVVFDTNTTERSSKDIQPTNVNLFECNLINIFNGSSS